MLVYFHVRLQTTATVYPHQHRYRVFLTRRLGGLSDCGFNRNYQSLEPFGIEVYDK